MRSGCPHSHGGAYPAFQHWSNVGALTSPQDNNVTSVPVVHPANGIQNNMIATQYPGELRVAYSPAQWQQGNTQSRQNFQGLHHQLESQASIASTGFQHPKSRDSACSPRNSRPQISRKARVSAQHSSYFGTSANENSVRQSVYNSGQQRECSKRNFSRHFLKGSNLNNNTGLQQRQHLKCAFSAGTSSAALQGDSLGVAAQTFPLQDQCSSVPERKQQRSYPLLHALLEGNPPDLKSFFTTPSSSSKETNANIELNTCTHFSDERHCKSQQVKSSLAALNCRQTRTQNLVHSGGTYSTPYQQQVSSPSLSSQPSTDKVSLVGEMVPPTDDQIQDFIAKRLAYFRTILTQKNRNYGHTHSNKGWSFCTNDSTLQFDCIMPKSNSVSHLPTTSASHKEDVERQSLNCAVIEQCTAAVGQALEGDSSKGSKANAELTPKSKETGDCAESASEKHSTGTLVSAVGNSKHAPKTETVEKSASVDLDLPVKKHLDVTMSANGDGKLVYSDDYEDKTFVGSNDESFHSKWCDKYLQNGMTTLHYSLTALKELIASLENVETIAKMDNFSKVILQQYWNGDIDNIHLFTSTEYPQIMMKVAATCTKNEDESPVTLDEPTEKHPSLTLNCSASLRLNINKTLDDVDQVPGVSWALKHMTEREKGDTGLKPVEAVGLDNVQGVTDVSEDLQTKSSSVVSENKTFKLTSLIENQDANTKKKKNIEDQQHCAVTCKEVIAHSKLNPSIDKIQIHNVVSLPTNQSEWLCNQTSCEGAGEDVGSVCSQTDLSIELSENKVKEHAPLSESKGEEALSVKILKDPQYEDISDDEGVSQLATKLPNTEHEELGFPACFEDLLYEDISEDENPQIENMAVERPSQVPELNNKQSPFENEGYRHMQGQAQMKTEIISDEELIPKEQVSPKTETIDIAQHCSCPCFVETDDGFEGLLCPKCDSKRHLGTNHSVSCIPSSDLEDEDKTDDQMDDDWIVIPISMSDLKFEPEDEDQDGPEEVVLDDGETGDKERQCDTNPRHCELHWPALKPVAVSAFSQIEVFDTVVSFQQAKAVQFKNKVASGWSTPEHEMDSEGEPHTPQNRRESYSDPEDSCETEDSCDYSSGSEHNYLTVSRQLLKKRSAPLPPETDDPVSKKEGQDDEVTNLQKGQTRSLYKLGCMQKLRQLIEAKAGSKHVQHKTNRQKISKKDDIIILDSDTEDESDQNYKKKAKRKRLLFSGSEDSGDAPCSQQKRHSPETVDSQCGTVKEKVKKNRLPSTDSPAPQCQSKLHGAQFKEVTQDACSDLSHSTEKSGQLIEAKAGSKHVQHKTNGQKISKKDDIIILDSDTEDDNDQNYKKANRKRLFSSGSADSGDAPCVQQKRHSPETVDSEYGTAKEKLQETKLSSADSSLPQHQSKLHDTQFKEVMQDECSDLSHSTKTTGQLIEAKGGSEHVQHKTNRQTMSEERRIVFHDSDKVVKKDHFSKNKANTKRTLSSGSEDSGDALFATKNRPSTETEDHRCGAANEKPKKPRLSSEGSPKKQPQSVDKETYSSLGPNPVIPRLVLESSPPNHNFKLLKESRVHMQGKDETRAPKTPTATSEKTDSCEKNTQHLYRNKKGRFVSKTKPANAATKNKVQANIAKPRLVSRQLSLPSQQGPSTSISSSSSTSGQLSEARQSSASSRGLSQSGETSASSSLPISKRSTSIPRHLSPSKLQRSHSYSNPSTLDHPYTPTKGPSSSATVQSTRKKVTKDWRESYVPTRRDRKSILGMEEDLRTTNYDLWREARPQPSHYDKSATPLMKKTKSDAIQWTKAIHRDAPRKQRYSVGEGYKWSEKPTVAKPTKGSGREGK